MRSLLVQHAIDNIWCEPIQDRQHFIVPSRLTPSSGAYKYGKVLWESVPLPNANIPNDRSYFHVYQLGQLKEQTFGLTIERDMWINLNDICETYGMAIDVYLGNGIVIPRAYCFLRVNRDENIILSIRINHNLYLGEELVYNSLTGTSSLRKVSLSNNKIKIRFYKNARFSSINWKDTAADVLFPIRSRAVTVTGNSSYTTFMTTCNNIETRYGTSGMAVYYLDGYLINKPTGYNASYAGKVLTFIWDSSIKGKFSFPLKSLPTFTSDIDGYSKYILLLNTRYETIDYQDDHDLYLVVNTGGNSFKGIYVDRMNTNAISMLTHNAYAVNSDLINKLIANNSDFSYIDNCSLYLVARQGGMYRGLTNTHNRIEELYRLPRSKILECLTGVNSSLPEWSAIELEKSPYTNIMSSRLEDITDGMVEAAYGYNSAASTLSPVFHKVENINGQYFVKVPDSLLIKNPATDTSERIAYTYNEGILQSILVDKSSNSNIVLSTTDPVTDVELLRGKLSDGYIKFYRFTNTNPTTVVDDELPHYEFRVYACGMNSEGQLSRDWVDITTMDYHRFLPEGDATSNFRPCIKWDTVKLTQASIVPLVRISDSVHHYKPTLVLNDDFPGYISFALTYRENANSTIRTNMDIAPGKVDVFLNDKSLIENIDYFIKFPRVVITKQQEGDVEDIDVAVRYYGSANPVTKQPYTVRDYGFVKDGLLSADGEYDVRDDRNVRVNVGGIIVAKDKYAFADYQTQGIRAPDGLPWSVSDYMVQIEAFTKTLTREYANISRDLDDRIERYLTLHLGQLPTPRPTVINERWRIYSPFASAILHLMERENYPSDLMIGNSFDVAKIDSWLGSWKYLLDFDPALKDFDQNYVEILPHPHWTTMEVTSGQYTLINYIVKNYLNDKVSLSRFLEIEL